MQNNLDILTIVSTFGFTRLVNTLISILVFFIVILYVVFSIIVVRQVYLMSQVVLVSRNRYIKFFSWLQLAFSLIFAYFILIAFVVQ